MTNYNGFTNHETWDFNNWHGDIMQMQLQDMKENDPSLTLEEARDYVADEIEMILSNHTKNVSFASSILCTAFGRIDYEQLADMIMEELNNE